VSVQLIDPSDHQLLVVLPQLLEHWDGVDVVAEELREEERQQLVKHEVALSGLGQTQGEEEVFREVLERGLEYVPHLLEALGVGQLNESFSQLDRLPHMQQLWLHFLFDALDLFDSLLPSGGSLEVYELVVFLLQVNSDAVLDEVKLQVWVGPLDFQDHVEGERQVLRLALGEYSEESVEAFGVEEDVVFLV
jgi:hypothetical protein